MANVNQAISLPVLLEKVSSTFTTVIKLMVSILMRASGAAVFIMARAYSGGHYQAFTFELTTVLNVEIGPIVYSCRSLQKNHPVTSLSHY